MAAPVVWFEIAGRDLDVLTRFYGELLGWKVDADNQGRFAVEPTPRGATIVWESSFRALDPAAEAEVSRLWAGMVPVVLGNLKTLIEQR